jgi:uncharacterized protein with PQ loop repeat
MVSGSHELSHHQKRKKKHHKAIIDKVIYPIAFIGPALILPQTFKIWMNKDATSISLFSWCAFLALSFFWMWYGVVHKEKPIIVAQAMWMVIHLSVILGTLLYG